MGDEVYVTITVPAKNVDASMPADVRRVEVYGATAMTPPPRGRFLEIAELVGTVSVAPPSRPTGDSGGDAANKAAAGTTAQGATVTVRDELAVEDLVPRELPALPVKRPAFAPAVESRGELRRFYLAIAFSTRGRPGPPGTIAELPLTPLPDAPTDVDVTYTSEKVTVAWQPSGGLIGFLLNQALPPEPQPYDEFAPPLPASALPLPRTSTTPSVLQRPSSPPVPASQNRGAAALFGPTRYNVYREIADPLSLPRALNRSAASAHETPLTPLNAAPLDALALADELEFERESCYVIRAVLGPGSGAVEGHPSERRCVTPVDTFPPAAPVGLSAVGAAGAISLIWEANTEDDVSGYLVLRGGSTDATLLPLTRVPIAETQFTDRNVTPGDRYVYAVVAVDGRVPLPNVSAESMRVEETAR